VGEGDRGEERGHGGDRLAVGVVAARRACSVGSIVMVTPRGDWAGPDQMSNGWFLPHSSGWAASLCLRLRLVQNSKFTVCLQVPLAFDDAYIQHE